MSCSKNSLETAFVQNSALACLLFDSQSLSILTTFQIPRIINKTQWTDLSRNYQSLVIPPIIVVQIIADRYSVCMELHHAHSHYALPIPPIQILMTIRICLREHIALVNDYHTLFVTWQSITSLLACAQCSTSSSQLPPYHVTVIALSPHPSSLPSLSTLHTP